MFKNIFKNLEKKFLSIFGRKLKIMTTFNGIGAFSYALKLLGVEVGEQVYCEIDKDANKTYIANNKLNLSKFINDINKLLVLVKKGERFDILIQTPPCQSFSSQGKRAGLKSLNGNLFITAIELQKKVDSSIVIYENVKGLVSHEKFIYTYQRENGEEFETRTKIKKKELKLQNLTLVSKVEDSYASLINPEYDGKKKSIGLTLKIIEEQLLEDNRYNYYWKVINSADQGSPQSRERIFIIGIKKELDKGFKFPENIDLKYTVEDVLENNYDESYVYTNPNNYKFKLSNQRKRKGKIHTYGKYTGVKYQSDARVSLPYVAPTITTGNNSKFLIDGITRKLTINENKKIHGFRDDFVFPVSKSAANTQNGNTVSPSVYGRIIGTLIDSLKSVNSDTKFIHKQVANKYSMNYQFMREEIAQQYIDFIANGGKVIVQVDLYPTKEDKKLKTNSKTYFIEVEEFEQLSLINPKYNTYRYKIKGKVTKHVFAYDEPFIASNLDTKDLEDDSKVQLFNGASLTGCKKDTAIGRINFKSKKAQSYLKKIAVPKKELESLKVLNSAKKKTSSKKRKAISKSLNDVKELINPHQTVLYPWAGSKRRFAENIQTAIQDMKMDEVEYSIDAFGGSMAHTILNISKIKAKHYVLNDLDPILASTYKAVKQDYKKVQEHYIKVREEFLKILPDQLSQNIIKGDELREEWLILKEYYQYIVHRLNESRDIYETAALFIFKMEYTTAGMFKYDKNNKVSLSGYNWKYKTRGKVKHIEYYSKILNRYDVAIENLDVFELIKKYEKNIKNSFIYLDPPYLKSKHIYNSDASAEFQLKLINETNKFKYRLYSNEDCDDLYKLGINLSFQEEYKFERPGKKELKGNEYLAYSINICANENIFLEQVA